MHALMIEARVMIMLGCLMGTSYLLGSSKHNQESMCEEVTQQQIFSIFSSPMSSQVW